jgi:hypothetical protein
MLCEQFVPGKLPDPDLTPPDGIIVPIAPDGNQAAGGAAVGGSVAGGGSSGLQLLDALQMIIRIGNLNVALPPWYLKFCQGFSFVQLGFRLEFLETAFSLDIIQQDPDYYSDPNLVIYQTGSVETYKSSFSVILVNTLFGYMAIVVIHVLSLAFFLFLLRVRGVHEERKAFLHQRFMVFFSNFYLGLFFGLGYPLTVACLIQWSANATSTVETFLSVAVFVFYYLYAFLIFPFRIWRIAQDPVRAAVHERWDRMFEEFKPQFFYAFSANCAVMLFDAIIVVLGTEFGMDAGVQLWIVILLSGIRSVFLVIARPKRRFIGNCLIILTYVSDTAQLLMLLPHVGRDRFDSEVDSSAQNIAMFQIIVVMFNFIMSMVEMVATVSIFLWDLLQAFRKKKAEKNAIPSTILSPEPDPDLYPVFIPLPDRSRKVVADEKQQVSISSPKGEEQSGGPPLRSLGSSSKIVSGRSGELGSARPESAASSRSLIWNPLDSDRYHPSSPRLGIRPGLSVGDVDVVPVSPSSPLSPQFRHISDPDTFRQLRHSSRWERLQSSLPFLDKDK